MSRAQLCVSRGPVQVWLGVSVDPAAAAPELAASADPEDFAAWLDAALPAALVACERLLAQAATQLHSGLQVSSLAALQLQNQALKDKLNEVAP